MHFFRVASHHWQSPDFLLVMRMVYDSIPESDKGLRNVVAEIFLAHCLDSDELRKGRGLLLLLQW